MMRHTKLFTLLLFLFPLLISCSSSKKAQTVPTSAQKEKILSLVRQLPGDDESERQYIFGNLIDFGPEGIRALTDMLMPAGIGDDTYVRYAVNGLARYVSRPGAESERQTFEEVVLEQLTSGTSRATKTFLMKQLELTGSDRAVPVLEIFLTDHMLYEPAVQALTAIGTSAAKQVLHRHVAVSGGKIKVAVIKALGDLQVSSAAATIMPLAESENTATRDAALYALAQMGQPGATAVLDEAVTAAEAYQRTQTQFLQLTYARRLAEEGYTDLSNELLQRLYGQYNEAHIKGAVLTQLVHNKANGITDKLLAAATSPDVQLRKAALALATELDNPISTEVWLQKLEQSSPDVQADIIDMLGQSEDKSAASQIKTFLNHSHSDVRRAAIRAYTALAQANALPVLINQLNKPGGPEDIKGLKTALLQMPGQKLLTEVVKALPAAPNKSKVILIELLASREATAYLREIISCTQHDSPEVRQAAFQSLKFLSGPQDLSLLVKLMAETTNKREQELVSQAIISAAGKTDHPQDRILPIVTGLEQADESTKVALLQTLPHIGGSRALKVLADAAKSNDPQIHESAIKTLSSWPESAAIPHLLDAFAISSEANTELVASGLARLIPASLYSANQKIQWLNQIADTAPTPEGKITALQALASLQSPEALRTVSAYLGHHNPQVSDAAVQGVASMLARSQNSMNSLSAEDGALSILETAISPQLRRRIEQQIRRIRTGSREADEFVPLFNGRDLSGWIGAIDSYRVQDGKIINLPGARGNLYTKGEYSDFVLRFEFKLTKGANNGLGIRAPLEGDAAYKGIELQILDNTAEKYADLKPYQYHGSVYGVVPARQGYLKPVGEWNTQEVIARGSNITVKLNGTTILNADINKVATPKPMDGREHPGLKRNSGHIGFLGHGSQVEFRNIRIKDLTRYYPDYSMTNSKKRGLNQPPKGFKALFNGKDLSGWKGLVGNPESRAEMSPEEMAQNQVKADSLMREHWSVRNGILYFDGKGSHLCTIKEYGDFEMLLDWKIEPGGDSGVYLRGAPQVQIWDATEWPQGSGGLYNNQQHPSDPLEVADNPIGEWNHMRIRMVGEKVTVHLNGELVVDNVVLENYWDRSKPIYSTGQIELQSHNTPLYFRNIFIREIPRTQELFNGRDLSGWQQVGGNTGNWKAQDGILYTEGEGEQWQREAGGGWLSTTKQYDNFKLELEYRLPEGGNSGVFLRAPRKGDPAFEGIEIQLLDDEAAQFQGLESWQYTGSIYDVQAPSEDAAKGPGQWQKMTIIADGPSLKVTLNGKRILNADLARHMDRAEEHPGLKRRQGYIGLQNHNTRVEFRNITITEIK